MRTRGSPSGGPRRTAKVAATVAWAAVAAALPAAAGAPLAPGDDASRAVVRVAGLAGSVRIWPWPVLAPCRVGRDCTKPAAGVTLVFSRSGLDVADVRTDDLGSYRVALPPGTYSVRVRERVEPAPGKGLRPSEVVVGARWTPRRDFLYDVGIR